jgi:hypothetical protein
MEMCKRKPQISTQEVNRMQKLKPLVIILVAGIIFMLALLFSSKNHDMKKEVVAHSQLGMQLQKEIEPFKDSNYVATRFKTMEIKINAALQANEIVEEEKNSLISLLNLHKCNALVNSHNAILNANCMDRRNLAKIYDLMQEHKKIQSTPTMDEAMVQYEEIAAFINLHTSITAVINKEYNEGAISQMQNTLQSMANKNIIKDCSGLQSLKEEWMNQLNQFPEIVSMIKFRISNSMYPNEAAKNKCRPYGHYYAQLKEKFDLED